MSVQWHRFSTREQCVQTLAAVLARQLTERLQSAPTVRALLPGGSSPAQLWPYLADEALDWSRVQLSLTDERWVPVEASESNLAGLMAGLPQAHYLDPRQGHTAQQAAQRWGEQLQEWLPFALVLLGMGEDGHFASLFPEMPHLAQGLSLAAQPAAMLAEAPQTPKLRLTANLAMLCRTHWLGLLVFGEAKQARIQQALAATPEGQTLPIYHLLSQRERPVEIYWAP